MKQYLRNQRKRAKTAGRHQGAVDEDDDEGELVSRAGCRDNEDEGEDEDDGADDGGKGGGVEDGEDNGDDLEGRRKRRRVDHD